MNWSKTKPSHKLPGTSKKFIEYIGMNPNSSHRTMNMESYPWSIPQGMNQYSPYGSIWYKFLYLTQKHPRHLGEADMERVPSTRSWMTTGTTGKWLFRNLHRKWLISVQPEHIYIYIYIQVSCIYTIICIYIYMITYLYIYIHNYIYMWLITENHWIGHIWLIYDNPITRSY